MPSLDLSTHFRSGAQSFIQTALVIDNEADLGDSSAQQATGPMTAVQPNASLLGSVLSDAEPPKPADSSELKSADQAEELSTSDSHSLGAKQLIDAFLVESVICGVYKPTPTEEMVSLTTKAAANADLVIVDWILEGKTSIKAREIIASILQFDLAQRGRLRLIAVYTAQPGRSTMAKEVLDHINTVTVLRERIRISSDGVALIGDDVRICFLNKPETKGGDTEIIPESRLPERLVDEFRKLTQGVLATFALSSLAAVRRAANHIVSVFRPELDGAFLSHRCSLPNPDDATEFAIDLIADQLRTVVSVNGVGEESLHVDVLVAWLDEMAKSGHHFTDFDATEAPLDVVKGFVVGGEAKFKVPDGQYKPGVEPKQVVSKQKMLTPGSVTRIFYASAQDAWNRTKEFSRIAALKREARGKTVFPPHWKPTLSLGSILKVIKSTPKELEQNPHALVLDAPYLFCVQPRCDCVRLKEELAYPFQKIVTHKDGKFNLVVKDESEFGEELLILLKPCDTVMVTFMPDVSSGTVRGDWDAEKGGYVFMDTNGRSYLWLGDVKDLKAQKDASELAARVHSVGIDDFEWLRRASGGGVTWPPVAAAAPGGAAAAPVPEIDPTPSCDCD